ncbi:MAG: putative secreted hydrolase [uncultured Acidimicrobiales bacterium]|uniref:Putative secreted hydrolase n=1 Tax=uncultured Acidimicrobiales bacterium TaxID=310071 RepID=A0A6J4HV47_9ACTN|nr:MAG: putative secreted hydrolase [uncultured Acidimicrobiales bacterium]
MPKRSARTRLLLIAVTVVLAGGLHLSRAAVAGTESYVALGDSYTAGPGIPIQLLDPLGCFRSDHNYPHLVAAARGSALRDVSCSGAKTRDLSSPQPVYGGPNPAQLDALDDGVTTVSLQIGGNDIGFGEIVQRCTAVLPLGTPCRDLYTRGGVDEISRRITATGPKVGAALAEVRRRSRLARTFVVGYPAILPEAQPGCWPVMPITPGDVPYLREKTKELNAMLATRAAAAGATYVDVYGPSVGHDACQLPGVRWIEPIVPLSPAAPVHPNALGMQGMAIVLQNAMAR